MKKLFGLLYPILIYYIIAYIVNFAGMNVFYGGFLNNGKAVSQEMMLEWFYSHSLLFTIVSAAISLPVFLYLYYRDKTEQQAGAVSEQDAVRQKRTGLLKKNIVFWIFMILASSCVSITWNQLIVLMGLGRMFPAGEAVVESIYSTSLVMVVLGSGLLVPMAEELLFRGIIYRRMRHLAGSAVAMVASSLAFGLFHGNVLQGVYAVGCSFVFVILYEMCQTIWVPIVSHCAMNLTSIFLTESELFSDDKLNSFPVSAAIAAAAVFAFLALAVLCRRCQKQAVAPAGQWKKKQTSFPEVRQ